MSIKEGQYWITKSNPDHGSWGIEIEKELWNGWQVALYTVGTRAFGENYRPIAVIPVTRFVRSAEMVQEYHDCVEYKEVMARILLDRAKEINGKFTAEEMKERKRIVEQAGPPPFLDENAA